MKKRFGARNIDFMAASENFRHFMNRLNHKILGSAGKLHGRRLMSFAVIESNANGRLHYHAMIDRPNLFVKISHTWSLSKQPYPWTDSQALVKRLHETFGPERLMWATDWPIVENTAGASYDKALWLLRRAKELADYNVLTKSGIIVGLGETNDEVVDTLRDLRAHGVDVVTIGQYLQPSPKHATIDRWVHPDEFKWFREQGEALGFGSVFSGPLVRSSYRADEQRHAAETGRGAVAY